MILRKPEACQRELISQAVAGDKKALETLLTGVQDLVFNLSLRMLGALPDAEDASQEILIRIMTQLSSFRGESAFSTWVYRVAVNYLLNYKKSMFAQRPLSFEFYAQDIRSAPLDAIEKLVDDMDRETMAEELKMSCTNVMLQCLDAESRCIFVLGTMFKIDSRVAGEVLDMTPENYRQKLSRIRRKVAGFLAENCGLAGGACSCSRRVDYAVSQRRIDPANPMFAKLEPLDGTLLADCKEEMEKLDELSLTFEEMPNYKSPVVALAVIEKLLESSSLKKIQQF